MKRGGLSANKVLKILRLVAEGKQRELAGYLNLDQSTVSRIENGEIWLTPDMLRRYIDACGGYQIIRLLMDRLQELASRLYDNQLPLKQA